MCSIIEYYAVYDDNLGLAVSRINTDLGDELAQAFIEAVWIGSWKGRSVALVIEEASE